MQHCRVGTGECKRSQAWAEVGDGALQARGKATRRFHAEGGMPVQEMPDGRLVANIKREAEFSLRADTARCAVSRRGLPNGKQSIGFGLVLGGDFAASMRRGFGKHPEMISRADSLRN